MKRGNAAKSRRKSAFRAALVLTELAKNLALHATGGMLLLRSLNVPEDSGIEILSLDTGPGVANFSECLRDGFSTAGTSGIGLGVVKRASQSFEVHSQVGKGTAIRCELRVKGETLSKPHLHIGAASVALKGEDVCGDAWAVWWSQERTRVVVADGLGHGEDAAAASRKAISVFFKETRVELPELIEDMHKAMQSTRGAAVSIAEINLAERTLSYVGIGNVSGTIIRPEKSTSMVSHNGTVGVQFRKARAFSYPYSPDAMLVMYSDGLKTQWNLDAYQGLSTRHPGLIAGILYRDFHRSNDDSTVLVVRPVP
jgi:anti-sigma regulatory factor (Ser/Thr protein kinase)